jgi:hypothetical protein
MKTARRATSRRRATLIPTNGRVGDICLVRQGCRLKYGLLRRQLCQSSTRPSALQPYTATYRSTCNFLAFWQSARLPRFGESLAPRACTATQGTLPSRSYQDFNIELIARFSIFNSSSGVTTVLRFYRSCAIFRRQMLAERQPDSNGNPLFALFRSI